MRNTPLCAVVLLDGLVVRPLAGFVVRPLAGFVVRPLAGFVVPPLAGFVVRPLAGLVVSPLVLLVLLPFVVLPVGFAGLVLDPPVVFLVVLPVAFDGALLSAVRIIPGRNKNMIVLCNVHVMRFSGQHFSRPPDKSAYWKTIFFISHPKHMLWVLKRTVSVRRFFERPKHMFN